MQGTIKKYLKPEFKDRDLEIQTDMQYSYIILGLETKETDG